MKKNIKIIFLIAACCLYFTGFSQENTKVEPAKKTNYTILNPESVTNISEYVIALDKTGVERFMLENERTILNFESGVRIELKSKKEMNNPGIVSYLEKNYKLDKRVYRLTDDLYVIGLRTNSTSKNEQIK